MKKILSIILVCSAANAYAAYLSYDDLVKFPVACSNADSQLKFLRELQRSKRFDPDPDKLSTADRAYNSRLKATIWWFAYSCSRS